MSSVYTTIKTTITTMINDEKQRTTLFIKPTLVKQARAQAIVEDLTLTTLVERALIKYLPKETIIKKVDIV